LGPIIPGYFNNSGEGNVVIHANADMKAAGAGLQANYSIQDNMYIGGGLDAFSYKARDIIFYSSERADEGVKGVNGNVTLGFYNHFGPNGRGYFESAISFTKGWQHFEYISTSNNTDIYDFSSHALSGFIGVGKMSTNVSFLGGINYHINFTDIQTPLPNNNSFFNEFISDNRFSYLQPFFGIRFGNGKFKYSLMWSLDQSIIFDYPGIDDFNTEPNFCFSFGFNYNFGRKQVSVIKI